jgi:predicted MFS family arabinose efflux permease
MGGSAIGLLFGIQAIGTALGPLICGQIADHYGVLTTFYFMAATIIFANMFVFFIPDMTKLSAKA